MWENHWTYAYASPTSLSWVLPDEDAACLPSASALFFQKLTRSCAEVNDSSVEYTYDASAGFALSQTMDAASRASSATHTEAFTPQTSPYEAPQVAEGTVLHKYYALPSTTTDVLNHTTVYHYVSGGTNPLKEYLAGTVTDSRGRVIVFDRDDLARPGSIKMYSAAPILLSDVDLDYANTTFPGAVTKIVRKAIAGADDPAWVTDLVKDIQLDDNGFPYRTGNDAADIHTTTTRGPTGRVLAVQSPNGGTRSNIFNSSGLLEATWLEDGSNQTYQHDMAGRLVLTRDATGHATGIEYDIMGRVVTAVRDMDGDLSYSQTAGLEGVGVTTDIISRADYEDATHKVYLTDPRGYISVRILDALGPTAKIITPDNESAPDTIPTEEAGHVTSFAYDLLQSPTEAVDVVDALGYKTIFKFDEFARLEKTLRQYGTENATELYSGSIHGFDAASGLRDSITTIRTPLDSDGAPIDSNATVQQLTNSITYDLLDRPETSTFAAGTDREILTRTFHTSTGIRYKDDTRDALADGATPAHWNSRQIECDSLGRPVRQTLPEVTDALTDEPQQPTTDIAYDAYGQVEKLTDAYNQTTTFGYDVFGNLAYRKSPPAEDAKSGQDREAITVYRYDAMRRLTRVVDPLGYAWNYEHDAAGRLTKATGPVVTPGADATHRQAVWQYFPDAAGNLIETIDPEGHSVTRGYYPNSLLAGTTTPVTFTDDTNTQTLVDVTEDYLRDALGRITRVTDGKSQATAFTHDGLGRTLTTTRDPDDARAKTRSTSYDALLPIAAVDAKDQHQEFFYNAQFRLENLNVIDAATGDPTGESLTYEYDLLGGVTDIGPTTAPADYSMGDPAVARSYDVLGRLQSETSNGVTSLYGYDLLSLLSKVTTYIPGTEATVGSELAIQHDAIGRTERVTDTTNGATITSTFGYDLAGNKVSESRSNGLAQASDFDPLGRVVSQRVSKITGTTTTALCRTAYQYDLLSNVTHMEEYATGVPDRIIDNLYNERSQLLSETQSETGGDLVSETRTRSETHGYDYAENRISSTSATHDPLATIEDSSLTRLFEYGNTTNGKNSNQLYQLTETPGGGTASSANYGYDENGNRTERSLGAANDIYAYDSFDRLTQLTLNTSSNGENGIYSYGYDPLTRRISRSAGAAPTSSVHHFAFSGSTPVHEWDTTINNGTLVSNVGGGVGGRLYTQDVTGTAIYPFHNVRGDVIAQFSTAGTMTWHATYAANGLLQSQTGARAGNYGANGKWEEVDGLINDGYRYRDRLTNTFLTPDPAGFIDGPNTYNYVSHNPWSAWDPNGLATVIPSSTQDIGYVEGISTTLETLIPTLTNSPFDAQDSTNPTVLVPDSPLDIVDLALVAPAIEANALPLSALDMGPFNWRFWTMTATISQLDEAADLASLDAETTKMLQQISQARSDGAHNWEIISGSAQGVILIVQPEALLFKGAAAVLASLGVVGKVVGRAGGFVDEAATVADDAAKWVWGQNKGVAKSIRQMDQRGWYPEQVTEAIKFGQQLPAPNFVNKGNEAIRYVHPQTGQSVVQDMVTKEIIHFGGPGFEYP